MKMIPWYLGIATGIFMLWEIYRSVHPAGAVAAATGSPAFFSIAPGVTEYGTVNATGGFTAAPDPNGIGGGFAT
jgi:hypothetical protein